MCLCVRRLQPLIMGCIGRVGMCLSTPLKRHAEEVGQPDPYILHQLRVSEVWRHFDPDRTVLWDCGVYKVVFRLNSHARCLQLRET